MKLFLLTLIVSILTLQDGTKKSPFPFNEKTGKVEFTEIVEVGLSKDIIFSNAKTWCLMSTINSGNSKYKGEIEMEDYPSGRLLLTFSYYNPSSSLTKKSSFNIIIDCRDGKYRYTIKDYALYFIMSGRPDLNFVRTWEYWHNEWNNLNENTIVGATESYYLSLVIIESLKEGLSLKNDF